MFRIHPMVLLGEHCEQAYCPALMCFHGGSCVVRSDKWLCLCPDGYTGKRCQHLRQQPTEEPTKSLTKRHPAPVLDGVETILMHTSIGNLVNRVDCIRWDRYTRPWDFAPIIRAGTEVDASIIPTPATSAVCVPDNF